jgi:hypothetical protein
MKKIKKFDEFFQDRVLEKDEDNSLLRDLENIGMKDRTYTKEMCRDAMNSVGFDEYLNAEVSGNDFQMNFDQPFPDQGEVRVYHEGGISVEVDTAGLWQAIVSELESLDLDDYEDDGEERYTIEDLESAFDDVDWQDIGNDSAEELYGDIEIDVDGTDRGDGQYDVSAEASIDSDVAEVDDESIINKILGNL